MKFVTALCLLGSADAFVRKRRLCLHLEISAFNENRVPVSGIIYFSSDSQVRMPHASPRVMRSTSLGNVGFFNKKKTLPYTMFLSRGPGWRVNLTLPCFHPLSLNCTLKTWPASRAWLATGK